MTAMKIVGKPTAAAQSALEPHIRGLYDAPGKSVLAIVELRHVERLQPAPGSDKDAAVGVKIVGCEIPNREQEGAVREAQRALYLHRTASGTLDDDGRLVLDEGTLKDTAGLLHAIEAARLRAGLAHWADYARRVAAAQRLTQSEMAHEVQAVADGLTAVIAAANAAEEGD